MTTENLRGVMKPPRPGPYDLQTLPTLPWMSAWPMSAAERLRLTNWQMYGQSPAPECSATSYPYKAVSKHWLIPLPPVPHTNIPPITKID
ncbi:hypothetical protein PoB_007629100 [Plakobranchus ocellatus]|uniref:Uncharacterized protein n=1 Tax=Plakobranchus ocellatus TaxID=259542 RepID=A0AAV4E101_9GAST|nr:hypothetical protein PoB_007629100 [Plakobranchus ocellatus]